MCQWARAWTAQASSASTRADATGLILGANATDIDAGMTPAAALRMEARAQHLHTCPATSGAEPELATGSQTRPSRPVTLTLAQQGDCALDRCRQQGSREPRVLTAACKQARTEH